MSDRDEAHPAPEVSVRPSWRAVAAWFLLGTAGLAVLAYLGAHLPRKPLGLLALAFGCLAAWGLLWLAAELAMPAGRRLLAAIALLIAAGQVGMALESHRAFAEHERERWQGDPAAWMIEGLRRQGTLAADEMARLEPDLRQRVLAERTSFRAYLAYRLSRYRVFPIMSTWHVFLWAAEVLVGTVLGTWLGWRMALATGLAPAKLGEGPEA